ncbi:MAG TPA: glutaredoxin [Caldilineae bacterium]|nr:glutaredoxin [Caldilineae bacterium]
MALLSPEDAKAVAAQFEENLQRPVKLVVATSQLNCMYCDEVKALSEELAELSPNLTVESYDLDVDVTDLAIYNLDKTPAIAIVADGRDEPDTDYGIRFYGIPSGYEFMSLLDAINTVGSDHVHLRQDTLDFLNDLDQDLHIQVFITPTCPHCPRAVILAHHLAYASPRVTADMVEAMEFQELSNRYNVYGVPRTVINETVHQEGAAPEPMLLQKLRQAVAAPTLA